MEFHLVNRLLWSHSKEIKNRWSDKLTKTLYILGAGGHGKVVADAAKKMKQWQEIYFLDDNLVGQKLLEILVKDKLSNAKQYIQENPEYIVAIGDNYSRREVQQNLVELGCKLATIIHPFSNIGDGVEIGEGTVILSGVVINPSSIIGKGCILNTSTSVDHDSNIKDYVHLSPGVRIAGNVTIGTNTWLGINSTVINNVKIVDNCVVGANSLIREEILETGTYVGNPIRRIR